VERPRTAAHDEELRLRLAAGDDRALGEAYDLFAGLVHGLALRVTRDADAARDVTQEVFIELWAKPLAFNPARGALRSWLAMLAHRRAVDWVRKEVSNHRAAAAAVSGDLPSVSEEPSAEEEMVANDVAQRVREVVENLSRPLRDAVELTYYHGNTCRGAATALGIPEGTLKSRLRRALTCIGTELKLQGLV
jgi:RNA polymerase sigma-70 factor (ECF subfamily)